MDVEDAIDSARGAGVEEEALMRALTLGVRFELEPATVIELFSVMEEAAADGVPQQPLVNKTAEGLVKNVPPDRVMSAVRAEAERYRTASDLLAGSLDEPVSRETLDRFAGLLAAGLEPHTIERGLAAAVIASPEEIANALEFHAALQQAGFVSEDTFDLAMRGLDNGFFDDSGLTLAQSLAIALRDGMPRKDILAAAWDALSGTTTLAETYRRIETGGGNDEPTGLAGLPERTDENDPDGSLEPKSLYLLAGDLKPRPDGWHPATSYPRPVVMDEAEKDYGLSPKIWNPAAKDPQALRREFSRRGPDSDARPPRRPIAPKGGAGPEKPRPLDHKKMAPAPLAP
jgi:hypothetical protein